MRRGQVLCLLASLTAAACEPEVSIPVEVEMVGSGASSSSGPYRIGTYYIQRRELRTSRVEIQLDMPEASAYAFGEGCLMLQVARPGASQEIGSFEVGRSRSLYLADRFADEGPLALVPHVATEATFAEGPVLELPTTLDELGLEDGPFQRAEDIGISLLCEVTPVPGNWIALRSVGMGTAEIIGRTGSSLGLCTGADERACHATVSAETYRLRIFPEDPEEEVAISCETEIGARMQVERGRGFVTEAKVGACDIIFGEEPAFRAAVEIDAENPDNYLLDFNPRFASVAADGRTFSVPFFQVRLQLRELTSLGSRPAALDGVAGDCEPSNPTSGFFFIMKPDEGDFGSCTVTPRSEARDYRLDIGDSQFEIDVTPGPDGPPIRCRQGGICDGQPDPDSGLLLYREPTNVTIEALTDGPVEFDGQCRPISDGSRSASVLVDGDVRCAPRSPPSADRGALAFFFPDNWGSIRVTGDGYDQSCDAADDRDCLFEGLRGPVVVEMSAPDGGSSFLGVEPPPGPIVAPDLPCGLVQRGDTPVFDYDPAAAAADAMVVARNATARCLARFECSPTGSFEEASFVFRSAANGVAIRRQRFVPSDCANGVCGTIDENYRVFLRDEDMTLTLEIDGTGDGTPLNAANNRDPLEGPAQVLVDLINPVPYGEAFNPFTNAQDPDLVPLIARARVCMDGASEDLRFQFVMQ